MRFGIACALAICAVVTSAHAQDTQLAGTVRDDSGTALPGVTVELRPASGSAHETVTDGDGRFEFDRLAAGSYQLTFTLINFATARRAVVLSPDAPVRADAVLHFAVNADVTVTARRTFTQPRGCRASGRESGGHCAGGESGRRRGETDRAAAVDA